MGRSKNGRSPTMIDRCSSQVCWGITISEHKVSFVRQKSGLADENPWRDSSSTVEQQCGACDSTSAIERIKFSEGCAMYVTERYPSDMITSGDKQVIRTPSGTG
jgi:hypothetical protein